MLEIIKTNDGYMVQKDGEDYICDAHGDNLWDTYAEAEAVFYGVSQTSPSQSIRDAVGKAINKPKTYKVWARSISHVYALIEAADHESAWDKAKDMDGSDFIDSGHGDWDLVSTEEVTSESKPACLYCGGNCPNDEDHACDGYLGDIDGLYSEDAK